MLHIARGGEETVLGVFRFRPFLRNKLCGEKLRCALLNLVVLVHHEHVISSPTVCAGGMRRRIRQTVIVVSGLAARRQKASEGISKPKRAKNVDCGLSTVVVSFGVKQRDSERQAVIPPHFHNVSKQLRLLVKILPGRFASVVGIMFKGHECKVLKPVMRLQIIEEAAEPGCSTLRVRPTLNVFLAPFKDWPSQLEIRVDTMKGRGEL